MFGFILFSAGSMASTAWTLEYNPEKPLAMVRRFKPQVIVKERDKNEWINAHRAHQLFSSDTLRTDHEGHAVVQFMDNSIARLKPNTELTVTGESNSVRSTSARMAVEIGEIYLNVTGQQSNYDIVTPTAVAAVKGTSFVSQIRADGSSTFTGLSGIVEVTATASGRQVNLNRRDRAFVESTGNEIEITRVSEQEVNDMEQEYTHDFDETATPGTLRLRFRNSDGQLREVELDYFDNE